MPSKIPDRYLVRVRAYITAVRWEFAKTMPQWPHWYTVRDWAPDKQTEYDFFATAINKYGYVDSWRDDRWHYLVVDEFKYWAIEDVLNRAAPKPNAQVLDEGEKC